MTSIAKPRIEKHLLRNKLGLTLRDYEGGMSTLCAGCGHDSVTAAMVRAFFELNLEPHTAAKVSGIGCSSKTTAYFLGQSHGVNAVHGRMPSVATGAAAANGKLHYIGVSGDGDSLSIGLGQFCHAIRRNVNMLYVVENNGVYGLTKGQFSAAADFGSKSKRGEPNPYTPIDPVKLALTLGATFVARSFSGDKAQLVPLIKAAVMHKGFALIDVISPCVTFNDHPGSTKSYAHTYEFYHPAIHTDYIEPSQEIRAQYDEGEAMEVELHDGSRIVLRKADEDLDPRDRGEVLAYLSRHEAQNEIVTGLLFVDDEKLDMNGRNKLPEAPLNRLPYEKLAPGSKALAELQKDYC
jgi:2-oxoglutarate ferredoxin oxidoreductase subunit beta